MRIPGVRAAVAIAAALAGVCVAFPAAQVVSQNQLPERQLPVFRADSHFVRVDAYPTDREGSIIRGLSAADFELTEDGTTQVIDSSEFIEYERWSPGSERPDPRDQRESFRLAADPRYRVVVVYLDRLKWQNAYYVRQPLLDLLTREIGPRDLFGILLPSHEASDLVLGQFTPGMQSMVNQFLQIQNHREPFNLDPVESKLLACFGQAGFGLIDNWRTDNLYRDLEGIVTILGTIRDERKSLILVTERMPGVDAFSRRAGTPPAIGGNRGLPPSTGRPLPGSAGGLATGVYQPDFNSAGACSMLASGIPDPHPQRFHDLIKLARRMNVAINPISPSGLTMRFNWDNSYLSQLAKETGGLAIVNTNGIKEGFKRVANDMSEYYVLGYYTTNTKWDGRLRRLRVKLKSTGQTVRARYEYQAPSAEEIAAMRAAADAPSRPKGPTAEESAMNVLARVRADAELHVHGALHGQTLAIAVEIPQGAASTRWRQGGDVEVTATDPQGQSHVGRTTMAAGARGAEVRLLLPSGQHGPWQVRARISQTDAAIESHARVAPDNTTAFGVPLLYRALPQPAAPFRPVADPQFWRTERMRAEWLLPGGGTPYTVRARLLQTSGEPLAFAPPVATQDTPDGVRVRVDLSLTSLASADYIIEVTAERDGTESRTLQAIRILR